MFAYGFVSVVLMLYLAAAGFDEVHVGLLLSCALVGDAAISLWITTVADRIGRRRMLLLGAVLMALAGIVFLSTGNFVLLALAAIIGVISPSGSEIGPFLSIEQAALSQLLPDGRRTHTFAWYSLIGSLATAFGALFGGLLSQVLQNGGLSDLGSYRAVLAGYVICGALLAVLFAFLSDRVEIAAPAPAARRTLGLHRSGGIIARLSALFALDAFAGGLVIQSIMAYWFHIRFGADEATLGAIFFCANLLSGLSALLAVKIAARIGLIRTMVFTHLPSNVLLCLVPVMPTLPWAIAVLLLRFSISQMDVPTRQSYTMAVVTPDERSAAAGVTGISRSIGAAISPALSGVLLATPGLLAAPFFLAGGLKIVYDLLLYRGFRAIRPPEEHPRH